MGFEVKTFEVRDSMTFIPTMGIRIAVAEMSVADADRWLAREAGFGATPCVLFMRLDGGEAHYDPYDWSGSTMRIAHSWIGEHWKELPSGAVVDVEYLMGATETPKGKPAR